MEKLYKMEEHIMKEGNINKQNEKQLKDWIWLNQKNMFKKKQKIQIGQWIIVMIKIKMQIQNYKIFQMI